MQPTSWSLLGVLLVLEPLAYTWPIAAQDRPIAFILGTPHRNAGLEFTPSMTDSSEGVPTGDGAKERDGERDNPAEASAGSEEMGDESETEVDEIETDRDSFTPATTTTSRQRWIVESAYSFIDNRETYETHSLPELLIRRGVTDRLELRLGWNFEVGGASNAISGGTSIGPEFEETELERESQISYGIKATLSEQVGGAPRSAVILQGGTPTSGAETASQFVGTYVFGWTGRNKTRFDTALRLAFDSERGDHFQLWAPSTVFKFPVAERWNVHAEYFGIFSDGREVETVKHFFSPGIHYLLSPDHELGVRLGWGLNNRSAPFFVNAGFAYRY